MKPILLDVPDGFESARLIIRSPMPGDGPEMRRAVAESIDDLRPWMPWATHVPTEEESEENVRLARIRYLERRDLRLHLLLKPDLPVPPGLVRPAGGPVMVGASGLHRINWEARGFEIGYWCRVGFQRQGYVTEAVHAIARFAFEQLAARRLEIRCDPRNARSRRVAERAGFRLEATLRQNNVAPSGEPRDTLVFALLREEWRREDLPASP